MRHCSEFNYVIDKAAALYILQAVQTRYCRAEEESADRGAMDVALATAAADMDAVPALQRKRYRVQNSWTQHQPNFSAECVSPKKGSCFRG